MAITETKFSTDKNVVVEGYRWIGKPRRGRIGGGIGILVKDEIRKYLIAIRNKNPEPQKMKQTKNLKQ